MCFEFLAKEKIRVLGLNKILFPPWDHLPFTLRFDHYNLQDSIKVYSFC